MTENDMKIPTAIFQAQALVQRARHHDHHEQYVQATKYYLQATKIFTLVPKKFPHLPIRQLCLREAKLGIQRIRQLRQQSESPRADSPPISPIDQQEADMRERILRCRFTPDPTQTWIDIIGLNPPLREVVQAIFLPLKHPQLLRGDLKMPRSILLFGPPGCGKTHLVRVVAAQAKLPFFNVSAGILLSKWQGESQKMIRVLYETAWEHAPSIIFIDEFDALFGASTQRGRGKTETSQTATHIQKELQQYMDGIHTPKVNETVTIVATNLPWRLEVPQIRRFDRRLYIPPPKPHMISDILERLLRKIPHLLSLRQIYWFSYELVMYTPDEMRQIVTVAYCRAYERAWKERTKVQINLQDLIASKCRCKPIMEFRLLKGVGTYHFRKWNKHFGMPSINYFKNDWEDPGYTHRNPIDPEEPKEFP